MHRDGPPPAVDRRQPLARLLRDEPRRQRRAHRADRPRPSVVAYTAGHTHRHRVPPRCRAACRTIEVGCVKDFPGTWAEYRVYEGGIMHVVHRISSPDALAWSERCRHLYRDFGIDYADLRARPAGRPMLPDRAPAADLEFRQLPRRRAASLAPSTPWRWRSAPANSRRAGASVLHLEVGQPSTPAPRPWCGRRRRGDSSATRSATPTPPGCPAAAAPDRRALSPTGTTSTVDPERVIVVAGASAGFTLAFLAAFDPGDRVGVVEPGYPCYRNTSRCSAATPVGDPGRARDPLGADPRAARRRRTTRRAGARLAVEPDRDRGRARPTARGVLPTPPASG